MVNEEVKKQKEQGTRKSTFDKTSLTKTAKIYFDAGKSDLKAQYSASLDAVLAELNKYPDLGVEISGFASAEGSETSTARSRTSAPSPYWITSTTKALFAAAS